MLDGTVACLQDEIHAFGNKFPADSIRPGQERWSWQAACDGMELLEHLPVQHQRHTLFEPSSGYAGS